MDGLSDESLLAGLGSGNPDAAAAFVRRFQGRVYGLALTMLRDPDLAEEVAQETFVRAWRHAASYDPRRGRVPAWLLTIARNLAIDRTRMRPVTPTDPDVIASCDHARLLEAVLEGEARRARALIREHVVEFERETMAAFNRDRDPGPATDRSS
jgi:RNA polymerase sigma factor (sigma-70 family)